MNKEDSALMAVIFVCEGPMTSYDLNEVIRDAIMRGGGDIWKVPDFLAAYTDKNTRKPLYKRVEAPMDGFLKIVPNTGCHFFNYKFYSGVEYGVDLSIRAAQQALRLRRRSELSPESHP